MAEQKFTSKLDVQGTVASVLAKAMTGYRARVAVKANDMTASVKSMSALLELGIRVGDEVTVTATGTGEEKAALAVKAYLTGEKQF